MDFIPPSGCERVYFTQTQASSEQNNHSMPGAPRRGRAHLSISIPRCPPSSPSNKINNTYTATHPPRSKSLPPTFFHAIVGNTGVHKSNSENSLPQMIPGLNFLPRERSGSVDIP